MKKEYTAKIVGHELFKPDPEKPDYEAIRLQLQIASLTPMLGKPTRGVLVIEEKELAEYPLRRFLRITVEDSQQEIAFPARGRKTDDVQLTVLPPPGEKPSRKRRRHTEEPEATH